MAQSLLIVMTLLLSANVLADDATELSPEKNLDDIRQEQSTSLDEKMDLMLEELLSTSNTRSTKVETIPANARRLAAYDMRLQARVQ